MSGGAITVGLGAQLQQLGADIACGAFSGKTLPSIIAGLGRLSPWRVQSVDSEVANAAELRRRPFESLLDVVRPYGFELDLLNEEPTLAWIFICHREGRVREAALDALVAPPPSPLLLALLAWRMNDWARPVRLAACHRAEALFLSVSPEVVAGAASLFSLKWSSWQRWTPDARALVDSLLDRPDVAAALASRFERGTSGPLPREFSGCIRRPSLDGYLVPLFQNAVEPAVRARALHALLNGYASWPDKTEWEWIDKRYFLRKPRTVWGRREIARPVSGDWLIDVALRDPSPVVRRVAADAVVSKAIDLSDRQAVIEQLGRDPSRGIRERADFLRRHAESR